MRPASIWRLIIRVFIRNVTRNHFPYSTTGIPMTENMGDC